MRAILGAMKFFRGSNDQNKLKNIQLNLRYLGQKVRHGEELPLGYKILMLQHLQQVKRQLGSLEGALTQSILGDLHTEGTESIETPDWKLSVERGKPVTKIDNQGVAEELLENILTHERRRHKALPDKTLENIVSTVFWKTIEASTPRWGKTKLRKHGVNLEDHGTVGAPRETLKIVDKNPPR